MKKQKNSISIVLPAFNEQMNIEASVTDAYDFLKKNFTDFEIIVVNDGSTDDTLKILQKVSRRTGKLKVLSNRKNQGYGAAVWKGLKASSKDLVFFSDSDRQFDLNEIKKLLKYIPQFDVVIGYRKKRSDFFMRKVNAWGWRVLVWILLGLKIKDIDCAFKLFKQDVIRKIRITSKGATFSAELIYQIEKFGFSIKQLPVSHFRRVAGRPTGAKMSVIRKAFIEIWDLYLKDKKLVKSRSFILSFCAIVALFASRILLMSNSLDFFDSSEYFWRSGDKLILNAMATGHAPFHPLYVFFGYVIHNYLNLSQIASLELTSVIMGSLGIIFLFLFLKKVFSPRVAWLASILYALIPFVYVSQITVLVDATEHAFFFLALLLFYLALEGEKTKGFLLALLAGLSLGLAAFAHTQVAIWAPAIVFLPIITLKSLGKKEIWPLIFKYLMLLIGGGVFIFLYLKLLVYSNSIGWHDPTPDLKSALSYLLFGNISDHDPIELRKSFYYLVALSSSLVVLVGFFGSIKLFFSDKRKLLYLVIWFLPFVIGATYIYENLYGRTLIIGLAPVVILASYFLVSLKRFRLLAIFVVVLQLCVLSGPVIARYKLFPAPIEHIKDTLSGLETGGIFISSNVTKTLANAAYDGEYVNFGDVGNGAGYVEEKVKQALAENRPIYILSDALLLPYHRYDGAYYDLRSTGVGSSSDHATILDFLVRDYALRLVRVDDFGFQRAVYEVLPNHLEDDLDKVKANLDNSSIVFGKIKSADDPVSGLIVNGSSNLVCNAPKDDITRLDAGFCLLRSLSGKRYGNWTFTDKDGWFFLQDTTNSGKIVLSSNPALTKISSLNGQFATSGDIATDFHLVGEFSDLAQLRQELGQTDNSFYVFASRENNIEEYRLYTFDFNLPSSGKIRARDLGGEASELVRDKTAESSKVRVATRGGGFVLAGPYITLEAGKYKLIFKTRSNLKKDNLIKFEVSGDYARTTLAEKEVVQRELAGKDYHEIELEFELQDRTEGIEFRIEVRPNSNVLVDYLELLKQ